VANTKHLEIIRKGADAIAIWRDANPDNAIDLSGADLRRFDLTHVNLNGADMRGASLEWTDLRWADLIGCDLSASNLDRADLHKADLSGTLLIGAKVVNTNLADANLSNADLSNARFLHARLLNTDLRNVKGLDACEHSGPSIIDMETMQKVGFLPKAFLRGCGVNDAAIFALYADDTDALAEAMETGSEYYSCFISNSSLDSTFAENIHDDIQEKGSEVAAIETKGACCYHISGVVARAWPPFPRAYQGGIPCCASFLPGEDEGEYRVLVTKL